MMVVAATLAPQEDGVTAAGLLYTAPALCSTAAERLRHGQEITADASSRRSWIQRTAEHGGSIFRRLL